MNAPLLLAHIILTPNGFITVDIPTGWNAAANTREEIAQAFPDERAGRMGHLLATGTQAAST
jgi:hypothetical protein